MDKPTSEKDVIKSFDGEHFNKTGSFSSSSMLTSLKLVKPVFDKMLAALKNQHQMLIDFNNVAAKSDASKEEWVKVMIDLADSEQRLLGIIKEVEKLGL